MLGINFASETLYEFLSNGVPFLLIVKCAIFLLWPSLKMRMFAKCEKIFWNTSMLSVHLKKVQFSTRTNEERDAFKMSQVIVKCEYSSTALV